MENLYPLKKSEENKVYKNHVKFYERKAKEANLKDQLICITHGDDLDGAMKLKEMIQKEFGCNFNEYGRAAIGAHSVLAH